MTTFVVGVTSRGGRIAAVSFRRTRKGLYPRRLLLLDELTGTTLWLSSRRARQFASGVPWSSPFALTSDAFLYLSRRGKLFALDFDKGAVLWKMSAPHGFALLDGGLLAVGANRPFTYNPETGARASWKLSARIPFPVTLARKSMILKAGTQAAVRTSDGVIHGIDPASGREVWKLFDENDSRQTLLNTPVSQGAALIRAVYPQYLSQVRVKTPSHEFTLPGNPMGRPMVSGRLATYLLKDSRHFQSLATLDLDSGKVLCTSEVNVDACTSASSMIVCRNGRTLVTLDQKTCNILKSQDFSTDIQFVSADGPAAALQLAGGRIALLLPADGKTLMISEIKIKGASTTLKGLMDTGGGRYVLLVRTRWPDRPRLDRIYAVVFDVRASRVVREIKLGRPTPRYRESRYAEGPEKVKMDDPVWKGDGLIVSCLDGLCQAVDPGTGRSRRSFLLPGRGPASLEGMLPGDIALIERGDRLFAVTSRPAIAWQTGIRMLEKNLVTRRWAFYGNLDSLVVIDLVTGRKVRHRVPHGYVPKAATEDAWYFKTARGGVVFKKARPSRAKVPYRYDILAGEDGLLFAAAQKLPAPGTWYAMDLKTGRVLWRKTFTRHPSDTGMAKDIGEIEPKKDSFVPYYWTSACEKGFLVPDPSHRCLYLVSPKDGSVIWSHCFFRLGGPPLVHGRWILLPAVGPHAPAGKPPKGAVPDGEGRLALYAIDQDSGRAKLLYTPPKPYSVLLPSDADGVIPVTLYSEHKIRRATTVLGMRMSVPSVKSGQAQKAQSAPHR